MDVTATRSSHDGEYAQLAVSVVNNTMATVGPVMAAVALVSSTSSGTALPSLLLMLSLSPRKSKSLPKKASALKGAPVPAK